MACCVPGAHGGPRGPPRAPGHPLPHPYSDTIFLGDLLETPTPNDFVIDGRERRRAVRNVSARVSGWNSGERCDCSGIFACAFNPSLPQGTADISYDVEVTWEKYPQQ